MGILRITVEISPLLDQGLRRAVHDVMVDTGSELTWIPAHVLHALGIVPVRSMRFTTANGAVVERLVGEGRVHAEGEAAPDYVVFGEAEDLSLLGARTLEGMNLRVDLTARRLLPAGPMPAATAA